MSFKGFQKGLVRAPQQFRAKFNIGEQTKDPVYQDAERRFEDLEKETKHLHAESKKYFNAINSKTISLTQGFRFKKKRFLSNISESGSVKAC